MQRSISSQQTGVTMSEAFGATSTDTRNAVKLEVGSM